MFSLFLKKYKPFSKPCISLDLILKKIKLHVALSSLKFT